ncbi:hypothetical protein [Candidatus Phytoplasma solani]|uniref:Uncharacterized protein n=1 Tax=Candidatus Phytoplasma solani TaxID=69896 RepID=A0A421NXH7_9MOLU|nr:hypothetical protein [Candidatus Phytoplasma solani]RMI88705.1 hypothetical protein PSSA1_v1c4340 [Candidatus Phytoplasma solani]
MNLIKKISKYIPYIFYISMMISFNVIIVKTFLFYQTRKQIEDLNQKHYNELEKQIKNLELNLTNLKTSINEFLIKKQQQIENLESPKEIQKQKNIIKPTNFNKNFKEITK